MRGKVLEHLYKRYNEDYDEWLMRHNRNLPLWFITVTLPKDLYHLPSAIQLDRTFHLLGNTLKTRCVDFIITPEHTSDMNIHYHGFIQFKDSIQKGRLLNYFKASKKFGFVKINAKPVEEVNIGRTKNYILEDLYETYMILKSQRSNYEPTLCLSMRWYEDLALMMKTPIRREDDDEELMQRIKELDNK